MKLLKNDSNFYYFTKGEGEPLVIFHGFPDCAFNYKDQLDYFSNNGFSVYVPFMPGYHEEDNELDTYQSLNVSEHLIKFIDSISDIPVNIYGHDWGASAAYGVANLAPDKVNKLITGAVPYGPNLMSSFLLDGEQQRRSWYMFFFQLEIAEIGVQANDFEYIKRLWREWSPDWPEYEEYALEAINVLSKPGVLTRALKYYRSTFQSSLQSERLNNLQESFTNKIQPPSLYIHGKNDGCIGSYLSEGMEESFEDLQIKEFNDCGHFLHLEKKEEVNKVLLDFLTS
ncbi:MAG: alpha/beta fold hydrolase [Gammaproteobacteria bacterium]